MNIFFKKINRTIAIEESRFPKTVEAYLFEYGLRQCLADSYASGTTDAERVALLEKRLGNLYDGNLRAARESDPVAQECRRLAFLAWPTSKLGGGKKANAEIVKTEGFKAWFAAYITHPAVIAKAEKMVAEAADLPDVEI